MSVNAAMWLTAQSYVCLLISKSHYFQKLWFCITAYYKECNEIPNFGRCIKEEMGAAIYYVCYFSMVIVVLSYTVLSYPILLFYPIAVKIV